MAGNIARGKRPAGRLSLLTPVLGWSVVLPWQRSSSRPPGASLIGPDQRAGGSLVQFIDVTGNVGEGSDEFVQKIDQFFPVVIPDFPNKIFPMAFG